MAEEEEPGKFSAVSGQINDSTQKILQNIKELDQMAQNQTYSVPAEEELDAIRKNFDNLQLENKDTTMKELIQWMKMRSKYFAENDEEMIRGVEDYHKSFSEAINMTLENMSNEISSYDKKLHTCLDDVNVLSMKLSEFYSNSHNNTTDDMRFPDLVLADKQVEGQLSTYSRETLIEQLLQMQEREKYFLDILESMRMTMKKLQGDLETAHKNEKSVATKMYEMRATMQDQTDKIQVLEAKMRLYQNQEELKVQIMERWKITPQKPFEVDLSASAAQEEENEEEEDGASKGKKKQQKREKPDYYTFAHRALTIEGINPYAQDNKMFQQALKKHTIKLNGQIEQLQLRSKNLTEQNQIMRQRMEEMQPGSTKDLPDYSSGKLDATGGSAAGSPQKAVSRGLKGEDGNADGVHEPKGSKSSGRRKGKGGKGGAKSRGKGGRGASGKNNKSGGAAAGGNEGGEAGNDGEGEYDDEYGDYDEDDEYGEDAEGEGEETGSGGATGGRNKGGRRAAGNNNQGSGGSRRGGAGRKGGRINNAGPSGGSRRTNKLNFDGPYYDKEGKLITNLGNGQKYTGAIYDKEGNLVANLINGEQYPAQIYDKDGKLILDPTQMKKDGNQFSGAIYDQDGNVISTVINGQTFDGALYDKNGNVITDISNGASFTGAVYDKDGNVVANFVNGQELSAEIYDAKGNPISNLENCKDFTGTICDKDGNVLYNFVNGEKLPREVYDSNGQLITDPTLIKNYTGALYDKNGNVVGSFVNGKNQTSASPRVTGYVLANGQLVEVPISVDNIVELHRPAIFMPEDTMRAPRRGGFAAYAQGNNQAGPNGEETGQYGPNGGYAPDGTYIEGQGGYYGPNGEFIPGAPGGANGYGPNGAANNNGQFGPGGAANGPGGAGPNSGYGPGAVGPDGKLIPGGNNAFGPGGVGPNGQYIPGGANGMGGYGPNGEGGPNGAYGPGGGEFGSGGQRGVSFAPGVQGEQGGYGPGGMPGYGYGQNPNDPRFFEGNNGAGGPGGSARSPRGSIMGNRRNPNAAQFGNYERGQVNYGDGQYPEGAADKDAVTIPVRPFEAEDVHDVLRAQEQYENGEGGEIRPSTIHAGAFNRPIVMFGNPNSQYSTSAFRYGRYGSDVLVSGKFPFDKLGGKFSFNPLMKNGKPMYSKAFRDRMARIEAMRRGINPRLPRIKFTIVSYGGAYRRSPRNAELLRITKLPTLRPKRVMGSNPADDDINLMVGPVKVYNEDAN